MVTRVPVLTLKSSISPITALFLPRALTQPASLHSLSVGAVEMVALVAPRLLWQHRAHRVAVRLGLVAQLLAQPILYPIPQTPQRPVKIIPRLIPAGALNTLPSQGQITALQLALRSVVMVAVVGMAITCSLPMPELLRQVMHRPRNFLYNASLWPYLITRLPFLPSRSVAAVVMVVLVLATLMAVRRAFHLRWVVAVVQVVTPVLSLSTILEPC